MGGRGSSSVSGQPEHHGGVDWRKDNTCCSTIPVNTSDAMAKAASKQDDGDVSELFEKALGMRWIIIVEISTVSPELLGLLDLYLRRAYCCHPYARLRGGTRKVPFGGINVIFAGDFWQLTPVKAHSLFANPFLKKKYSSGDQKILQMFWNGDDQDSTQKTWLLRKPLRSQDAWLNAVLHASRNGEESWEMYCFNHGFPTRNPGSWMPDTNAPTCGNVNCAMLAALWGEMRLSTLR